MPSSRERRAVRHDPPDSPTSVGYTEPVRVVLADAARPLPLAWGGTLAPVEVEYEAYGTLNPERSNAILVCHALSGDAHAAGWERIATGDRRAYRAAAPGWWDAIIGPGKAIDTRRFFVLCPNVLGSCYGTTGPSSPNPATGQPYGPDFPDVTVEDWVDLQARLLDHLGIARLHTVVGGSLGGQQALEWALRHPARVRRAIVFAAAARLSPQGMAFNHVGRHAILADPAFRGGRYAGHPDQPGAGLGVARMLAHITYLAHEGLGRKARTRREPAAERPAANEVKNGIETFLRHVAQKFVERFDANSYLRITHAMDDYDAARARGGDLVAACRALQAKLMLVSFSSDWLYPPAQCRELALAVSRAGGTITYVNVPSDNGHDAFLVDTREVGHLLASFLGSEDRP
jgi:homoserine O-acetyltransferase/O-succinyltransferase